MGYKCTNDMRNTKLIYVPLRTYSQKEQEEPDKQVEEMLQKYIIARTRSLLSAPVLFKKKDNNHRVVVDYTKLNEKTGNDDFPLTIPRTTSEILCSARYYSLLDHGLGYLQEESTRRMFQKQHSTQEQGHLHI